SDGSITVMHGEPSSPGPQRALSRTSGGVRSRLSFRTWTANAPAQQRPPPLRAPSGWLKKGPIGCPHPPASGQEAWEGASRPPGPDDNPGDEGHPPVRVLSPEAVGGR